MSKIPIQLAKNLSFLGEIDRTNDFKNNEPIGKYQKNGEKSNNYAKDDYDLIYKSTKGLMIITGCSHAGIFNIIEYAKNI